MELEVLKNKDIDQQIESNLTLRVNYESVVVKTEEDRVKADNQIKRAKLDLKEYSEKMKGIKKAIDEFKGKFLSKEKIEEKKIMDFVSKQEEEITEFKRKKKAEQDRLKAEADRIAKEKADALQKEEEDKIAKEKANKMNQIEEIKSSHLPTPEKLSKVLSLQSEVSNLDSVVVPEIEVKAEKVVLKKDEIKTKKVFEILDEAAFIEFAIKENRKLIQITVSKSGFNEWIKSEENQAHPFLTFKEEII